MSGIGGWLDRGGLLGAEALPIMSRALLWHGGAKREGYCSGCVGLFENQAWGEEREARPAFFSTEYGRVVLVMDGEVEGGSEEVVKIYGQERGQFAHRLRGSYALALWDEGRGELFLARSADGAHKLFYSHENFGFRFCSEIKGLLAITKGRVEVDRSRLRLYLKATEGALPPEFLYDGIYELPRGQSVMCNCLGLCFLARDGSLPNQGKHENYSLALSCEKLGSLLRKELLRHDAPFFEVPAIKAKERKRMESDLDEILRECDGAWRSYLFMGQERKMIEGEQDPVRRLRLMAMMIQSVWWSQWVTVTDFAER